MWSPLLLSLLLLHLTHSHVTFALATASGGLTVIEGSTSISTTTTTTNSSGSSSTPNSTLHTGSNNNNTASNSSTGAIANNSASGSSGRINNIAISNSTAVAGPGQRKRHRKRNSSWYDYRNYNENTTALEWLNPCTGSYHLPPANERHRIQRPKQIFNQLKRAAGVEYRMLNHSQDHKGIDIRDMHVWSLHNHNYKFLPKLKPNSTIALKRWYRNMQTYVASFAYLRRVQVNWDRQELKRESPVAKELKDLLLSSRSMLCELESAVNHTYPALIPGRFIHQLPQISRNDMNKRLKLLSKRRQRPSNEADAMDMRFVKHHYYEFLRTMWQLLRRDGRRERQQREQRQQRPQRRLRRQHKQHRQRQRQQQQLPLQQQQHQQQYQQQQQHQQRLHQLQLQHWQQQQRLQLSLSLAGNRKEFNEVSKPMNDSGRRGKRQQPLHSVSASTSASASTSTSASASTSASTLATATQKRRMQRT